MGRLLWEGGLREGWILGWKALEGRLFLSRGGAWQVTNALQEFCTWCYGFDIYGRILCTHSKSVEAYVLNGYLGMA